MNRLIALTAFAACIAATASASSIIYGAGTNGDLYTINPTTGITSEVGAMGTVLYDIAEYNGKLYGISATSDLYSINTTTGHATEIGSTGEALNALTFSSTGILYAAGLTTTDLYTVNTTTGAATKVPGETTQPAYDSAGDLEFIAGVLYLTTGGDGFDAPSTLDTVNLTTGALTAVGAIKVGSTPVDDVFGLAVQYGVLYGFTSDLFGPGEVISINPATGAATDVAPYGGTGRGAFTFYGTTDDPAPEPGTLGVMGLGLLSLGAAAYRRRRA